MWITKTPWTVVGLDLSGACQMRTGIRNVTVDGNGLIDGQGQAWWDLAHRMLRHKPPVKTDGLRPRMLTCEDCTDFTLRGVRLLNSPSFHVYASGFNCKVTDISIQSPNYSLAPNTDGTLTIDYQKPAVSLGLHSSVVMCLVSRNALRCFTTAGKKNFQRANCVFTGIDVACNGAYIARNRVVNGDDSLCVKSPGSNILFEDNYSEQGNGIVIGTSSNAQISNITYRHCVSNRTAYGMHIKFKDNQTGSVSGVLYENLTVIQPHHYVMGINQNDQGRRRRRRLSQQQQQQTLSELKDSDLSAASAGDDEEDGGGDGYRPLANVSISDITYRNIRTVGGKALSAGHFQCDVIKHGHEDGVKGPPCTGLTMQDVKIESVFGCEFEGVVRGKAVGTVEPPSCIPPR